MSFFPCNKSPPSLPDVCFIAGFAWYFIDCYICYPGVFCLWGVRAAVLILCGLTIVLILCFFIVHCIDSVIPWVDCPFFMLFSLFVTDSFVCFFYLLFGLFLLPILDTGNFSMPLLFALPLFVYLPCLWSCWCAWIVFWPLTVCELRDVPRSIVSIDLCAWVFYAIFPPRGWIWYFLFCLFCWYGLLNLVYIHVLFFPGFCSRSFSIMWVCNLPVLLWWLFLPGPPWKNLLMMAESGSPMAKLSCFYLVFLYWKYSMWILLSTINTGSDFSRE